MSDVSHEAIGAVSPATAAPRSRGARSWLFVWVKVLVTLGLLGFVVWRVDVNEVLRLLGSLRPAPLAAAFGWVVAAIGVSAFKWRRILQSRGITAGLLDLTRLYYIASFFNALLPTGIGGDPIRAWLLGREKGAMAESFASVVSERLIAGVALGISSAVGLLFMGFSARLVGLVLLFLAINVCLAALFLIPRIGESVVRAVIPPRFAGAAAATREALLAVRETLSDFPLALEITLYSMVFQACVAMVNYSLFSAVGDPVSVGMALVYSPMISTVSMLPVSLSGLGVPQVAYAYFFGLSGAPAAASVAVSLGFFAVIAISTLPGALFFLFAKNKGETDGL